MVAGWTRELIDWMGRVGSSSASVSGGIEVAERFRAPGVAAFLL
jgi:hypothetical protein